jgi:TonB family protein
VAKQIEDTTANIDDMLAGLTGGVPAASGSASGAGRVPSGVDAVQGGRGAVELASIDGLLQGTGAGQGASSRGVERSGVDVVDDGLATEGAGSAAWGRDSRSLMAVVQRYKSGVKFCYDNALKKAPHLNGKVTLEMDIFASGAVSGLRVVGDTLGDPALQRCILAQVRNWRFKAIDSGTVRFTLPLVFSPPNG